MTPKKSKFNKQEWNPAAGRESASGAYFGTDDMNPRREGKDKFTQWIGDKNDPVYKGNEASFNKEAAKLARAGQYKSTPSLEVGERNKRLDNEIEQDNAQREMDTVINNPRIFTSPYYEESSMERLNRANALPTTETASSQQLVRGALNENPETHPTPVLERIIHKLIDRGAHVGSAATSVGHNAMHQIPSALGGAMAGAMLPRKPAKASAPGMPKSPSDAQPTYQKKPLNPMRPEKPGFNAP